VRHHDDRRDPGTTPRLGGPRCGASTCRTPSSGSRWTAWHSSRTRSPAPPPWHPSGTVTSLLKSGALLPEPIVYEDFLPWSAAGIFQSNLTDAGTRDDEQSGAAWDAERLSDVIGIRIHDPMELYTAQQEASMRAAEDALGLRIDREDPHRHQPARFRTTIDARRTTLATDRK
jgi:hypothetical protein